MVFCGFSMVFCGFSMVFCGFSMVFCGFSMVFCGFSMVFCVFSVVRRRLPWFSMGFLRHLGLSLQGWPGEVQRDFGVMSVSSEERLTILCFFLNHEAIVFFSWFNFQAANIL